ncbi:MAG: SDR family NAD(P)-dependent oxidoreductase, partial [Halobacteriales archaeon]
MSDDFDLTEPELTAEDLLVLDDPHFGPDGVAVVTGAASGIGQATAVALAANGLTVVGADIDEDGLDETADLAADVDAPGEIRPVETDLTDDTDVDAMIEAAAGAGDLQYVANIAGMQHIASIRPCLVAGGLRGKSVNPWD